MSTKQVSESIIINGKSYRRIEESILDKMQSFIDEIEKMDGEEITIKDSKSSSTKVVWNIESDGNKATLTLELR